MATETKIGTDNTAPLYESAKVSLDGKSVVLTFNKTIHETTATEAAFTVTVNNTEITPTTLTVKDKTVILTLPTTITKKQAVTIDYVAPVETDITNTDAAIQDITGNNMASFTKKSVTNSSTIPPDVTSPVFKNAEINADGETVVLTFNETIYETKTAIETAFTITVNNTKIIPTDVAVQDKTVILTLPIAITKKQLLTINYDAPPAEKDASNTDTAIQDIAGNNTASFTTTRKTITNNSTVAPDLTSPTFKSAEINEEGKTVVLTFDEILNAKSATKGMFAVMVDGVKAALKAVVIQDSTISLTLVKTVGSEQIVTVTYNAPTVTANTPKINSAIQDVAGNDADSFKNVDVINNSTADLKAPTHLTTEVSDTGTSIVLTYDEELSDSNLPDPSAYTFKTGTTAADLTEITVTNVAVAGETVTLTLKKPVTLDQTVMELSYTPLIDNETKDNTAIQDKSGNDSAALSSPPITNNSTVAAPSKLTVNADVLALSEEDNIINAVVTATASTLNPTDQIDGGKGTDTLNVKMSNANFGGFSGTGKMQGVENVDLIISGTGTRSFDATGTTGITKFDIDGTDSFGVAIPNLAAPTVVAVELADQKSGVLSVGYVATTGTTNVFNNSADKQSVTVTDVGTALSPIDVDIAKVETLNVVSSGAVNYLNLTNVSNATTVDISGTAATTIVVGVPASMKTFHGGAGNEKLTVMADKLASNVNLAGGTGSDMLIVNSAAATAISPIISGIETIEMGTITGDLSINGSSISADLEQLVLPKDLGGAIQIFSASPKLNNLTVQANGSSTKTMSIDASGTTTLNYVADATTLGSNTNASDFNFNKSDQVIVNVGQQIIASGTITAGQAKKNVSLNVASKISGANEQTVFTGKVEAPYVENFTVNAAGKLAGTLKFVSAKTGSIVSDAAANSIVVEAPKLTTLTITKNTGNLTLVDSTFTALQSLTASEIGKKLTLPDLPAAATLEVIGNVNADSAVTFSTIGSTSNTNAALTLTATELGGGLITGAINGGLANVTIDVTKLSGDAAIGAVTTTKAVEIKASNVGGNVVIASIKGDKVTVDAVDALKDFTITNSITSDSSVSYKGLKSQANTLIINGSATSTALDVSITGGLANDTFTVNAGAKQTAVTVSGDLRSGVNTLTVNLAGATTGVAANVSGVSSAVSITDGSGADSITGTSFNDTISSTLGNDSITGGAGNDSINIAGTTGTVTLTDFGKGTDVVRGAFTGAGTLKVTIDDASTLAANFATVLAASAMASISGGSANDTITGGSANDTISGGFGNDIIRGGEGDDSVSGDTGDDTISVGNGSNTITVTAGTDTLLDLGGTDKLAVSSGATVNATLDGDWTARAAENAGTIVITTVGDNVNMTAETGTGTVKIGNAGDAATLIGGSGADTITAGSNGDSISGGAGADSLIGAAGIDTIVGGTGNDTITSGSSADVITVDAGSDTITDLNGTDNLAVSAGATAIATVTADWTATGSQTNAGSIVIQTAGFNVDMSNEIGTGTVKITDTATSAPVAATHFTGGSGADTIIAGIFSDSVLGGAGADSLVGNAGDDTLDGATDNDILVGGNGNDSLVGGTGVDSLTGGLGSDIFNFGTDGSKVIRSSTSTAVSDSASVDVITDFTLGDTIIFGAAGTLPAIDDSSTLMNATSATPNVHVNQAGLISFSATDSTFGLKVAAVEADSGLDVAGTVAVFKDGSDSYIYYSGAAIGNSDDQIVRIAGVNSTGLTLNTAGQVVSLGAIEVIPPEVGTIAIASATGLPTGGTILNAGDVVSVTVPFNEIVTVTGVPQLRLSIGSADVLANYSAGTATNSLTFTYTILAGQTDANGIAVKADSLMLNNGTIKDLAGNAATLTHTAVADNANFSVDTTAPIAFVMTQTIANTGYAAVSSSEATGAVYLVKTTLTQPTTLAELVALNTANDTSVNTMAITSTATTNFAATGLIAGSYKAYAVDAAGSLSAASTNTLTITNDMLANLATTQSDGNDIINGNQGSFVSDMPVSFNAAQGNDQYVISLLTDSHIIISNFTSGDKLVFDVTNTANGLSELTAKPFAVNDNGTDISLIAYDGTHVHDITLVGMTGSRTSFGGHIDNINDLNTFLGASAISFI